MYNTLYSFTEMHVLKVTEKHALVILLSLQLQTTAFTIMRVYHSFLTFRYIKEALFWLYFETKYLYRI